MFIWRNIDNYPLIILVTPSYLEQWDKSLSGIHYKYQQMHVQYRTFFKIILDFLHPVMLKIFSTNLSTFLFLFSTFTHTVEQYSK